MSEQRSNAPYRKEADKLHEAKLEVVIKLLNLPKFIKTARFTATRSSFGSLDASIVASKLH